MRSGPWRVAQRVDHPDPDSANALALADLEGGADALVLVTAHSPFSRGFGLAADRLPEALAGVELDLIATRLDAGVHTLAAATSLAGHIAARRWTSAHLDLDLGYDPVGLAASGHVQPDDDLQRLLDVHAEAGLAGRPLLADTRPYHEAGAPPALELGCGLAVGLAHLRRLEASGRDLAAARSSIAFLVTTDADTMIGIAKMRAMRRLWARIEAACGLEPQAIHLHAETSWRMLGRYDPWVNAMRTTSAIVAAGLGGADVVTALPCTLARGLPDAPTRRLARNAQRMAIDEAHLDAVIDPAAGAGTVEDATEALCADAWSAFQQIEQDGGPPRALQTGSLRARLAEAARRRAEAFVQQSATLVGITRFPSLDADAFETLDVPPRAPPPPANNELASIRDAAAFEMRRDRVEALAARPTVALVGLGSPARFGPRAAMAANLLAVAGLASSAPQAAARGAVPDDLPTGAPVCLVGDDEAYRQDGAAVVSMLRATGVAPVLVCGPASACEAVGADLAIDESCDLLATLDAVLDRLMPGAPR